MTSQKNLKITIITILVIIVLSMFPITVSEFAYGMGETKYYIFLYLALVLCSFEVIANLRVGFFLILICSISYIFLLNNPVGESFLFKDPNPLLILILLLPYFLFLTISVLICKYLTLHHKYNRRFVITSIILILAFPLYLIADRCNKNYSERIYADVEFQTNGIMRITCKPGFADSREFYIVSNSKELASAVKSKGEYYQGSYQISDLKILKNFHFRRFNSFSISMVNGKKINSLLTWTAKDLRGDASFLTP